jgi:hypothetical protein
MQAVRARKGKRKKNTKEKKKKKRLLLRLLFGLEKESKGRPSGHDVFIHQ